jgi:site-specific recombinase XerD/ribosomal protein L40E
MGTSAVIYGYDKILNSVFRKLRSSSMSKANKELIEKFSRYLFVQGLSQARIIKYVSGIAIIARMLDKPLNEASKEDIIDLVQKIEKKDYTDWTKHDYKLVIKKFYKFLRGTEDYPEEVSWIKLNTSKSNHMLPEELLTEDEVKQMAEAARTTRDKALILVLYESGCRIGEVLSLKIRNVRFDEHGAQLTVNGKTGMRRVRIIASSPALATWINNHPFRENPDAPLWVSQGTRNRDKPLMHRTVVGLLKRAAIRAGIRKRIYPHLFRHSRATHLANHLTEAQMKEFFGWVRNSDMASVYVHLSGRDVDDALLRLNGIETGEKKEVEFKPKICYRCNEKNSPIAKFCDKCGSPLDVNTALKIDEVRAKADKLLSILVQDPEILDKLLDKIEQLKAES